MASLYSAKDINPVSWEELDVMLNTLVSSVTEYFAHIDAPIHVVAPLLRTGGIVGGMLAVKMHVLTMLPVQFKYLYHPTTIQQRTSIPDILVDTPAQMNILLCEGNTSSGGIARAAAQAIKEKYPQAKIYLATLTKVFGGPEKIEGIEHIFYGRMTDENAQATAEEKERLHLREGIILFPWENAEDELADLNA